MVMMSERGEEVGDEKTTKPSSSSNWAARLKDPRIVRVSRASGGKDRHSKVCTVKGLRDRRVRLSVPTAIQLYDLQDRLGLNQPSKVVDWLLTAAKHEIDELPPLQLLPGNLGIESDHDHPGLVNKDKSHEVLTRDQSASSPEEREFWKTRGSSDHHHHQFVSGSQFMRWDGSTLSLAQSHHDFQDNNYNNVVFPFQATQLVYHPNSMNQSCFPMDIAAPTATSEYHVNPRQIDFQMLNPGSDQNHLSTPTPPNSFHLESTTQPGLPFHLSTQGPSGKN